MVILPMVHQYQRMLQRNLLYTAVTRSKELLILLGEEHAYATCVANESASRMTTLKSRIIDNEKMTITLRTKLAAYEDSLIGNDPFEDGTYTKESQDIKEQLPIKDDSGTNESKNQVMETVEPDLFSSSIVEEKKEEIESAVPKEFVLTAEAINQKLVDPMIGMENITPYTL